MASREKNERTFGGWEKMPNGGRALYIKEVDVNDATTRFGQEIYDREGRLIAVHEKFPVDSGHRDV